ATPGGGARRVRPMLRPGGEMILLSRIGADRGFRHLVEGFCNRSSAGSDGAPSFLGTDSLYGPNGEPMCA
ncbi:MAG: hypothetical protein WCB44_17985, partial [Stellaceae bacterium]